MGLTAVGVGGSRQGELVPSRPPLHAEAGQMLLVVGVLAPTADVLGSGGGQRRLTSKMRGLPWAAKARADLRLLSPFSQRRHPLEGGQLV